jgi:hypothetical protein
MREAGHKTAIDRIARIRHDHRDRLRGSFGRQRSRRSSAHDQIHLQTNQLRHQTRKAFTAAIGRAIFDDEIAAFDVPKVA